VGQRKESFVINLGQIFDLVNFVPIIGLKGAISNDKSHNTLSGVNIDTIAIEWPISCLSGANDVIGAWASVRDAIANFHAPATAPVLANTKSRLGNPLVNELVVGLPDKGAFNQFDPFLDATTDKLVAYVQYPTFPAILNALFLKAVQAKFGNGVKTLVPTVPRGDLVAVFATGIKGLNQLPTVTVSELMRLNTTIAATVPSKQNSLGVIAKDLAGFPNGRRPGDDVIDIALRVMLGVLCPSDPTFCNATVGTAELIDGAPIDAFDFDLTFPFLKTPLPGGVNPSSSTSDATMLFSPLGFFLRIFAF